LGAFDLEDFGDGVASFGGGFPVNFVIAVAGEIFAKFFEVSALADGATGVGSEGAAFEEDGGDVFTFGKKIGIDANFGWGELVGAANPEAKGG